MRGHGSPDARPIETARLLLRRPRRQDAPSLFAFLGDEAAMRHTQCLATLHDCRRHIAGHEWQRRRHGFAPWTVVERAGGRIIGWGGLFDDPFDPGWGPELGYWVSPTVWGRGYASELVQASLGFARDRLGWAEIQAFVRPENGGSRCVLEKAGFSRDRFVPALQRDRYFRLLPNVSAGGTD